MGGTLHLQNGKPAGRDNLCVSGYQAGRANYALSNFENNNDKGYDFIDPDIGAVHFPTSEHYLHFQKMDKAAKQAALATWQAEPNPRAILLGSKDPNSKYFIRNGSFSTQYANGRFDSPTWDAKRIDVQMQINAAKYQQSAKFRDAIQESIALGKNLGDGQGPVTIIEDTSSASVREVQWGTGPSGHGMNILGNSQTAFARMVERGEQPPKGQPQFNDYRNTQAQPDYVRAQNQFQNKLQPTLIATRTAAGPTQTQTDTSQLGSGLVQVLPPRITSRAAATDGFARHAAPPNPNWARIRSQQNANRFSRC